MIIQVLFVTFLVLLPHSFCAVPPITPLSSNDTTLRQIGSAVPSIIGKSPFAPRPAPHNTLPKVGGPSGLITCESINFQWKECKVGRPIWQAHVHDKLSSSPCQYAKGYFKGYSSIIVDKGCRATFWYNTYQGPLKQVRYLRCDSFFKDFTDFQNGLCWTKGPIDDLFVHRKHSDTYCIVDASYFKGGSYVYVKKGCKATFGYTLL